MSSSLTKKLKNLKDYRIIRNEEERANIIIEYAPLIKFIAQKIASRLPSNIELDDLISCGVIGLMDAIEKFDHTRDNKFKTYAEFRIRGSILDELRSQDWLPRSIREKAKIIEKVHSKLENELGRAPSDDEMSKELKVTREVFQDMLNKAKSVSLLNIDDSTNFNKKDRRAIAGMSEDSKYVNPFTVASNRNFRDKIKEGIEDLPENQRLVLSLYYYEDLNLKEIGKVLSVTESRISQLHSQAIEKIRNRFKKIFKDCEGII